MRKESKNGNTMGKVVAKQNLPSKVCVVCNRPFTWRKKWERVWDEVTTCSKSCNAKRKSANKQQQQQQEEPETTNAQPTTDSSTTDSEEEEALQDSAATKKLLRKQHKQAVKEQKRQKRAKREGKAPHLGRKPCDLCSKQVDLLVRCTVDESQQYKMVCGRCWPSVSGGVPDGSPEYPYYNYGGLWKNRNAPMKKRIGSGPKKNDSSSLVEEIQSSLQIEDGNDEQSEEEHSS